MFELKVKDQVSLDQFNEDMEDALGLPFCQLVNPRQGLLPQEIEEEPDQWGLIIPKDQADAVDFSPSSDWSEKTVTISSNNKLIDIKCWHSHTPKFVVIARSQIEVMGRKDAVSNWNYLGLAYSGGNLTPAGRMAEEDANNPPLFRRISRYLLAFVNEKGEIIQSEPLALTTKGGYSGSFGKEVSEYNKEFDAAYCELTKSRKRSTAFAQAFFVHAHQNNYFKDESKMAYTCVEARVSPVAGKPGKPTKVKRGDRTCTLHPAPVTALMLSKGSEAGKKITQWFSENVDFSKPNRGRDEATEEVEQFTATGTIEAPDFQANGNCKVTLVYGDKQQTVLLPPTMLDCLEAQGDYTVTGVLQAGLVVAESVAFASGPVATVAPTVEQGSMAGVGW